MKFCLIHSLNLLSVFSELRQRTDYWTAWWDKTAELAVHEIWQRRGKEVLWFLIKISDSNIATTVFVRLPLCFYSTEKYLQCLWRVQVLLQVSRRLSKSFLCCLFNSKRCYNVKIMRVNLNPINSTEAPRGKWDFFVIHFHFFFHLWK